MNLHLIPTLLLRPYRVHSAGACSIPLLQRVPAGFPSPADDYVEKRLDINEHLVRHPAATFLFDVTGDSMMLAGILDGDKVVVDRSIEPADRHIVVALVRGERTLKRLFRRGTRVELRPENPAYKPIVFNDGDELEIWGVVVGVVRRYPC